MLGVSFSGNVRVYVSPDPNWLAQQQVRHIGGGNPSSKAQQIARNGGGEAVPNGVFIFTKGHHYNRKGASTVANNRKHMLNHELVHIAQYQRLGHRYANRGGPLWLMEGSAEYIANKMESGAILRQYLSYSRKQVRNLRGNSLAVLETGKGMNAVRSSYEISGYAASKLVDRAGLDAVMAFYERLGRGQPWKAAFEASFGLSPNTFYASFP